MPVLGERLPAVLNRNLKTGLLSQRTGTAACLSQDGTAGDLSVHCRTDRALSGGYAGVLAPSGRALYFAEFGADATNTGALAIFSVARTTGAFRPLTGTLGCATSNGNVGGLTCVCRKARAVEGAYQVAVSGDGRFRYLASWAENGASLFRIAP